ncbi:MULTISPECIES: DUF4190 domain-containing protein [Rothia]|jgi:integral membrane protein|uniref:DUF4190 domain-containing protein n=1 Tax=Rothia TaxID=32207 RepID=UPI0008A4BE43|nr:MULTISPECIES: DUF4190 domain-containing protein [Rothia]OFP56935.1 hypothetical protein HMPREF2981_07390 [Rothia sp. HMSC069C01]OFR97652.1 hypothetical protein HMPREF2756_10315 [Rothia sp. HMSC067H10]
MSENVPNTSGHSGGQSEQPKFVPAAPPVAPAGNAYSGYVPTKLPAGMAIASLVMGIVSILGALPLSFITIVVALVGLILGIIALRKVRKGTGGGKGMAIGGVVTSAIGFILSAVVLVLLIIGTMMMQECKNTGVQNSDGSVTCSINGQKTTVNTDGTTSVR